MRWDVELLGCGAGGEPHSQAPVHVPDTEWRAGAGCPYSVVACALLVRMYVVSLTVTRTRSRLHVLHCALVA